MLIREQDDGALLIGQAIPRAWLQDGKVIEVQRAPTYFGPMSFTMRSESARGIITAEVSLSQRRLPGALLVRFRHPDGKPLRAVTLNGKAWTDFSSEKEWVRIPSPGAGPMTIVATY
jgi:hypothetical protein